jgi:hypothetical protein
MTSLILNLTSEMLWTLETMEIEIVQGKYKQAFQ